MPPADAVPPLVAMLLVQSALGGVDTVVDHEWRSRLDSMPGTAPELRLHAMRSALYALLFAMAAAADWHGLWAALPLAVALAEICVTARDAVVESRLRHVPALERVLHVLLLVNAGGYTVLLVQALGSEDAVARAAPDAWRVLLALAAAAALAQAVREAGASRRRRRLDGDGDGAPSAPSAAARAGASR